MCSHRSMCIASMYRIDRSIDVYRIDRCIASIDRSRDRDRSTDVSHRSIDRESRPLDRCIDRSSIDRALDRCIASIDRSRVETVETDRPMSSIDRSSESRLIDRYHTSIVILVKRVKGPDRRRQTTTTTTTTTTTRPGRCRCEGAPVGREKDESVLSRGDDRDRGGVRSGDEEEGSTLVGGVRVGA